MSSTPETVSPPFARHWAAKYIGLPYEPGARGPETVDCWGLAYLIYKNEYKIQLPLYPGVASATTLTQARVAMEEVNKTWHWELGPFEGAMIAMSQQEAIHHVGVYTKADGGKVIHCWNGHPVVADTLRSIMLKGFRSFAFYRHNLWPI